MQHIHPIILKQLWVCEFSHILFIYLHKLILAVTRSKMDKIQGIINHPVFMDSIKQIELLEMERKYCKHDMKHFVAVTKIMTNINNKENLLYTDEQIHAAGLLHDVGKFIQYQTGEPHQYAGIDIAETIMSDVGFSQADISLVLTAIKEHSGWVKREGFSELLRKSDKLSRQCYECQVSDQCKWPIEMRNKRSYL